MSSPSLEALFERYRRAGDLAAMAEVFDRTAPGLLALAAHVVRDPVEAEDLVQATFLAVLENARAFEAERRLEPWLAGILVRQALHSRRERARRADPSRLERAGEDEPSVALERRELAAALASAVDDLPEPYRTVLERHLRGERALDIARESGRAPGTIRMQILRGLERLRRMLPAGLYALVPVRTPRGLDAIRAQVLQGAAPAAAVGSAVTLGWIGGLAMGTKTVCVVAAVVLGLVVLRARVAGSGSERESREVTSSADVVASPPTGVPEALRAAEAVAPETREPAGSAERTPAPARSANEPRGLWIVVSLLGLDSEPEDATIAVATKGGMTTEHKGRRTCAIEVTQLVTGIFMKSLHVGPPETELVVSGSHPSGRRARVEVHVPEDWLHVDPTERRELEVELAFSVQTAVIGRIETEDLIASAVQLALDPRDGLRADFGMDGGCEEDGRFALFPARGGLLRLIAIHPGVLPLSLDVEVPPGRVTDVGTLRLDQRGAAIEGWVAVPFATFGCEPAQFEVRARRRLSPEQSSELTFQSVGVLPDALQVLEARARVRSDGRFRIEGLDPGDYTLELEAGQSTAHPSVTSTAASSAVQVGAGHGVRPSRYLVPSYPAADVVAPANDIVFGENYGRVRVRVDGAAKDNPARVAMSIGHGMVTQVTTEGEPVDAIVDRRAPLTLVATAGERGSARLESAPLSRALDEELVLALDEEHAPAAVHVTWTLPAGARAPTGVCATWRREGSSSPFGARTTPDGCTFTFANVPPGPCVLTLEPRDNSDSPLESELCTSDLEVELVTGGTVEATIAWVRGGRARFLPDTRGRALDSAKARVSDALGRRQSVSFTRRTMRDGGVSVGHWSGSLPLSGASELELNLPPGDYALELDVDGVPLRVPFTIVAGEVVDVPFVVP